MDNYISVLKKYAVFEGRAGRREYWMFFLFTLVISIILSIVSEGIGDKVGVLGAIYGLGTLLPSLGVGIRRLHDTGRSGYWILISLIPLIGTIWIIVLLALKGNAESNKYGPSPYATMAAPSAPISPAPTI